MKFSTPAHTFGAAHPSAVKVCWTIDRTSQAAGGSDNGFLDCARAHTPGYGSDSSTAEAATNLINCLGAGQGLANIVGHGNDGLIVTGQGQTPSDPNKFITTWNENIWGPLLKPLKGKAGTIKLWACHPGTGQEGADLLYSMMLETNATCMGPTGFLYCSNNGFYLEPNSTWQVASVGSPKPKPINAPTPHFLIEIDRWSLRTEDAYVLSLDAVEAIEVRRNEQPFLTLREDAARGFLRLVDFANPFQTDGVFGAVITGELIVTVLHQGQRNHIKFKIYNNRLLVKEGKPTMYYHCSEGFGRALLSGIIP